MSLLSFTEVPMFEATISAGTILSICVTIMTSIVVVTGFVWAIRSSVGILDVRLTTQDKIIHELKEETRKLAQVMTDMAVSNTRQDGFERRLILQGERLDRVEHVLLDHLRRMNVQG